MNEIKYTTDGKKVVVIGDLNQTEKIVQEIFVTDDGAEIPSGERFVAKSLLDSPAKSWKETKLAQLEAEYEKTSKDWESKIDAVKREKQLAYDALSGRVKWLRQVARQPHPEALSRVIESLASFLSNEDKWVLVCDYSDWHLSKFNEDGVDKMIDVVERNCRGDRFDSMRLLSLYGKSDGNFEYRVSGYSDGSGGDGNVMFFKSKEDALAHMQEKFDGIKEYGGRDIKIAEKFNLKFDEEKLTTYNANRKSNIESRVAELKGNLLKAEAELNEFNNK